jgi:hypothetical protein
MKQKKEITVYSSFGGSAVIIHCHSRSGILKHILFLTVTFGVAVLIFCVPAGAADCTSCHAGKQVLPGNHPDTKDMTIKGCLMCHGKDKAPLSDTFMSIHEQMLSGGSSSSKAPEASGKVRTSAASASLQKAK